VTEGRRPARRRALPVPPPRKPRAGEVSARPYALSFSGRVSALLDALAGGTMDEAVREGVTALEAYARSAGMTATPERLAFRRAAEAREAGIVTRFDRAEPFAGVLLRFLGRREELQALGAEVAAQAADIFVVWVNLIGLVRVLEHPATVRAEPGRTWQAADTAVEVARVHALPPHGAAAGGLTGAGTLIGVVDTFIDLLHPDLREADGATRLAWLHDLSLPPRAGPGQPALGARHDRTEIDAAIAAHAAGGPPTGALAHLVRARDLPLAPTAAGERRVVQTHGTAVAGIAAGAGRLAEGPLPGIAPGADLAFVAAAGQDEHRFGNEAAMLAGVADLFATATPLTPFAGVVVNLSNGDNLGPHDGGLLGEQFLDALLLLPGRALVVAAGNEHLLRYQGLPAVPMPAHALVPGGAAARDVELALEFAPGCLFAETAELWFDSAGPAAVTIAGTLGPRAIGPVTVREADGTVPVPISPAVLPAGFAAEARLSPEPGGPWCLSLTLRPAAGMPLPRGIWRLTVHGARGDVHAWVDRNNRMLRRWLGAPGAAGVEQGTTLNVPATARRVLAVASLDAKPPGEAMTVSAFSGRGPVRGGTFPKPELAAVGAFVTAPSMRGLITGAGGTTTGGGTSYAAPQVAGAAALYCERIHALTGLAPAAADIRQVLCETARRDGFVLPAGAPGPDAAGWDPAAGFGALDIAAMVAATADAPVAGADLWLQRNADDTGLEPLVSEDLCASPAIALSDEAGAPVTDLAAVRGALTVAVRYANRGDAPARDAVLRLWAGPAGLAATPPSPASPGLRTLIGEAMLGDVPGGARGAATLVWGKPDPAMPVIIATLDSPDDPLSPDEPIPARNNTAVRSLAAARIAPAGTRLRLLVTGSAEEDGLVLRAPGAAFLRLVLPAAALPWRDAALHAGPWGMRERPHAGAGDEALDPVARLRETAKGAGPIEALTEALGAEALALAHGTATIEAREGLVLPRLRIAHGATIALALTAGAGAERLTGLMLSGGRRVAACTVRLAAGPRSRT
jgi:subtilisin family serine protease